MWRERGRGEIVAGEEVGGKGAKMGVCRESGGVGRMESVEGEGERGECGG